MQHVPVLHTSFGIRMWLKLVVFAVAQPQTLSPPHVSSVGLNLNHKHMTDTLSLAHLTEPG